MFSPLSYIIFVYNVLVDLSAWASEKRQAQAYASKVSNPLKNARH